MSRTVTLAGYALIAAAIITYQLAGRILRRTPTIAEAVALTARRPVGRALLLVWWLWIGWHFFVRSHVG